MEQALKPCPFCGNTNIKIGNYKAIAGTHYYAQCDYAQGGCRSGVRGDYGSKRVFTASI